MRWYSSLVNYKIRHIQDLVGQARSFGSIPEAADPAATGSEALPELQRPSEYLRRRCPLCFGGEVDTSRCTRKKLYLTTLMTGISF